MHKDNIFRLKRPFQIFFCKWSSDMYCVKCFVNKMSKFHKCKIMFKDYWKSTKQKGGPRVPKDKKSSQDLISDAKFEKEDLPWWLLVDFHSLNNNHQLHSGICHRKRMNRLKLVRPSSPTLEFGKIITQLLSYLI